MVHNFSQPGDTDAFESPAYPVGNFEVSDEFERKTHAGSYKKAVNKDFSKSKFRDCALEWKTFVEFKDHFKVLVGDAKLDHTDLQVQVDLLLDIIRDCGVSNIEDSPISAPENYGCPQFVQLAEWHEKISEHIAARNTDGFVRTRITLPAVKKSTWEATIGTSVQIWKESFLSGLAEEAAAAAAPKAAKSAREKQPATVVGSREWIGKAADKAIAQFCKDAIKLFTHQEADKTEEANQRGIGATYLHDIFGLDSPIKWQIFTDKAQHTTASNKGIVSRIGNSLQMGEAYSQLARVAAHLTSRDRSLLVGGPRISPKLMLAMWEDRGGNLNDLVLHKAMKEFHGSAYTLYTPDPTPLPVPPKLPAVLPTVLPKVPSTAAGKKPEKNKSSDKASSSTGLIVLTGIATSQTCSEVCKAVEAVEVSGRQPADITVFSRWEVYQIVQWIKNNCAASEHTSTRQPQPPPSGETADHWRERSRLLEHALKDLLGTLKPDEKPEDKAKLFAIKKAVTRRTTGSYNTSSWQKLLNYFKEEPSLEALEDTDSEEE